MLERTRYVSLLGSVALGLLAMGCVDPAGDYDEFIERSKKTTPFIPDSGGGGGCDPALKDQACEAPAADELTGTWLFALSAHIARKKPILFQADIVQTDATTWEWTITPLDSVTRQPLPGAGFPKTLPSSTIPANGAWSVDLEPLDVPGAANPITGSDITADTALAGNVCGGRDFLCGDVTGNVTKPIPLDLATSTWTIERLPASDGGALTLPETISVDCNCQPADPPADAGT